MFSRENNQLEIACVSSYQDSFWANSNVANKLYQLDNSGKVVINAFVLEEESVGELYSQSVVVDNKLVMIPYHAKKIAIFDFGEQTISYVDVLGKSFKLAYHVNDNVYMIDCKGGTICIFDPRSYVFCEVQDIKKELSDFFCLHGFSKEGKIILPCRNRGVIYVYDTMKENGRIYNISECDMGIVDIACNGEVFYLLIENGVVIKTDGNFKIREKLDRHLQRIGNMRYPYRFVEVYKGNIYLFPMYYHAITVLDEENDLCEDLLCGEVYKERGKYDALKGQILKGQRTVIILPSLNTRGFAVDLQKKTLDGIFNLDSDEVSLIGFLDGKFRKKEQINNDKQYGERIWEYLR